MVKALCLASWAYTYAYLEVYLQSTAALATSRFSSIEPMMLSKPHNNIYMSV
jgi:hypothetical protein